MSEVVLVGRNFYRSRTQRTVSGKISETSANSFIFGSPTYSLA